MRFYKVYRLEVDGGIKGLELIEANGDAEAMRLARSLSGTGTIEVWDRSRLVGQAGGAPADAIRVSPAAAGLAPAGIVAALETAGEAVAGRRL